MSDQIMDQVQWVAAPPIDRPRYIPILSPKVGVPCAALVVSPGLVGVNTHFMNNRTQPCTGAANGCFGCKAGLSARWKGYLGCWHPGFSRYILAELTAQAASDCHALLGDGSANLRGMEVIMHRRGKARNGPVQAEFRPGRIEAAKVPAPFDVKKALMRIWERRVDDRKDPLPDLGEDVEE